MPRARLGRVETTFSGFDQLVRLHSSLRACGGRTADLDMAAVTWMDANMCAPLGAVLLNRSPARVLLRNLRSGLEEALQRNGFLPNFGFDRPKTPDVYGTTIEYPRFQRSDSDAFKRYVERHFVGKGIPEMSTALRRRFRASICEVFDNAVEHSQTELGIFACGQHFPHNQRLDFCIADLGIGIRRNILETMGQKFTSRRAIAWAMEGQNTTRRRRDGRPGGLGLKLIWEFIKLNRGKIHIVSDRGFWSFVRDRVASRSFSAPFPGTVVNIEINTADTHTYCLASEIDPDGIF